MHRVQISYWIFERKLCFMPSSQRSDLRERFIPDLLGWPQNQPYRLGCEGQHLCFRRCLPNKPERGEVCYFAKLLSSLSFKELSSDCSWTATFKHHPRPVAAHVADILGALFRNHGYERTCNLKQQLGPRQILIHWSVWETLQRRPRDAG